MRRHPSLRRGKILTAIAIDQNLQPVPRPLSGQPTRIEQVPVEFDLEDNPLGYNSQTISAWAVKLSIKGRASPLTQSELAAVFGGLRANPSRV